ncbi:AAA family ATPase [Christiangramia sabulilitoris]|uniref:AAA family ATPase n=1 Tax=Christiangramia sabulilitoris TaxID=2583991 RepID=A0A550I732_9FLAO|nr:ATP-binding protein [Christiangramia sabulilitoris]TRO66785.1 AAA family ATPase [Christiangramia sabulilitoris]
MLLRFSVKNFLSFKDDTEFNMFVGKNYRTHSEHVRETSSGVSLIKAAAIYGANGAGKSNLVEAIDFLKFLIIEEKDEETVLLPKSSKFKLDKQCGDKPSVFRIEFESGNVHYDYAVEIEKGEISDEWLYIVESANKNLANLVFRRKKDSPIDFEFKISEEDLSFIRGYEKKKILKANETFLSIIPEVLGDYPILTQAFKWFEELRIIKPHSDTLSIPIISSQEDVRKFASNLLKSSKTGVLDIHVSEVKFDVFFSYDDEDFKIEIEDYLKDIWDRHQDEVDKEDSKKYQFGTAFWKKGKLNYATYNEKEEPVVLVLKPIHIGDIPFELGEESDGTNRLLELAPVFYNLLEKDTVVIVDEIERSMHPILAKQLLSLFLSKADNKSQLIFTTHESNLLDQSLLRQDEIWFTEKRNEGSTDLFPLSDFSERYDKDIQKGYLQGRYGAIPFMSNLSDLNWNG